MLANTAFETLDSYPKRAANELKRTLAVFELMITLCAKVRLAINVSPYIF